MSDLCPKLAFRSVYGQIKTKARSRLGHGTGDKLVYCHEALHLQDKMQTAGYKPPVEAWERESSGSSTDEEDLAV